jgi:hypothetical protein
MTLKKKLTLSCEEIDISRDEGRPSDQHVSLRFFLSKSNTYAVIQFIDSKLPISYKKHQNSQGY